MVDIDQWIRTLWLCLFMDGVRRVQSQTLKQKPLNSVSLLIVLVPAQKRVSSEGNSKGLAGAFSTCGHCQCAGGRIH